MAGLTGNPFSMGANTMGAQDAQHGSSEHVGPGRTYFNSMDGDTPRASPRGPSLRRVRPRARCMGAAAEQEDEDDGDNDKDKEILDDSVDSPLLDHDTFVWEQSP